MQKTILIFLVTLCILRFLKMIHPLFPKKQKCFLKIIEHNLNPFPRQVEAKEKVLFQRTIRGPQYLYQGHFKEKLAAIQVHSPMNMKH